LCGSGHCDPGSVCTSDDMCISEAEADRRKEQEAQQEQDQLAQTAEANRKAEDDLAAKKAKEDEDRRTRKNSAATAVDRQKTLAQEEAAKIAAAQQNASANNQNSAAAIEALFIQRRKLELAAPPTAVMAPSATQSNTVVKETRRIQRPVTPSSTGDFAKSALDNQDYDAFAKSLSAAPKVGPRIQVQPQAPGPDARQTMLNRDKQNCWSGPNGIISCFDRSVLPSWPRKSPTSPAIVTQTSPGTASKRKTAADVEADWNRLMQTPQPGASTGVPCRQIYNMLGHFQQCGPSVDFGR
jgi:hypothetical protein